MVENQAGIGTLPVRQINAFSHYESASPAHEDPEPADLGALEEFGRPRCTVYAQITGSNPVRSANTRGCIHAHGIRIGNGAQVAQAEHALRAKWSGNSRMGVRSQCRGGDRNPVRSANLRVRSVEAWHSCLASRRIGLNSRRIHQGGHGQVARHLVLIQETAGSIPAAPSTMRTWRKQAYAYG